MRTRRVFVLFFVFLTIFASFILTEEVFTFFLSYYNIKGLENINNFEKIESVPSFEQNKFEDLNFINSNHQVATHFFRVQDLSTKIQNDSKIFHFEGVLKNMLSFEYLLILVIIAGVIGYTIGTLKIFILEFFHSFEQQKNSSTEASEKFEDLEEKI